MNTKTDRMWRSRATRGFAFLTILLFVTTGYLVLCRPYQLHWGATDAEIERSMAGDELNLSPSFLATRAITIEGSPEEIWPWLVQMGYGRAGYYGYDLLENAGSLEGLRSADEILPRFQGFVVGDELPISAVVSMRFHTIEPNRHLIWLGSEVTNPGAFTWALYPLDKGRTRLVSRIRWTYHPNSIGIFALELFTEFADHIAVRKILQGVKQRVEQNIEPMWIQYLELFTFICTLFTFLTALALLCWRRLTWKTWGAGVVAGVLWLTTWYAPVANWFNVLLALFAIGTLFLAHCRGIREQLVGQDTALSGDYQRHA
ncbi:MAG: hypothetical protein OEO71_12960 [Gammaproteobacteria bacterium]|nr:hypothetical protein [Gammaproteobacteria bacterium]